MIASIMHNGFSNFSTQDAYVWEWYGELLWFGFSCFVPSLGNQIYGFSLCCANYCQMKKKKKLMFAINGLKKKIHLQNMYLSHIRQNNVLKS